MGKDILLERYGRYYEIAKHLTARGNRISGICLDYRPSNVTGNVGSLDGVAWQKYDVSWTRPFGWLAWRRAIGVALESQPTAVVLAGGDPIPVIAGYSAARRFKRSLIVDLSDNYLSLGMTRIPGMENGLIRSVRSANAICCVSEPLADHVEQTMHPTGKVVVVENGCPDIFFHLPSRAKCRTMLGLPEQSLLIGTTGDLHPSRGIETLIEAFLMLRESTRLGVELVLAGRKHKSSNLPDHPNVRYIGVLDYERAQLAIGALDVGVICNRDTDFGRYCFPQKAAEYMAAKLPIVAASVGVMKRILSDSPQYLYVPEDANSLVKALARQLEDQYVVPAVPETWEQKALKMEQVLKRVAENRSLDG